MSLTFQDGKCFIVLSDIRTGYMVAPLFVSRQLLPTVKKLLEVFTLNVFFYLYWLYLNHLTTKHDHFLG